MVTAGEANRTLIGKALNRPIQAAIMSTWGGPQARWPECLRAVVQSWAVESPTRSLLPTILFDFLAEAYRSVTQPIVRLRPRICLPGCRSKP